MGDLVLQMVAKELNSHLRAYDRVGRFGGEEFLIVLADTDDKAALQTAERLRKAIAELYIEHEKFKLSVSISMGVSCCDCNDRKKPDNCFQKRMTPCTKPKKTDGTRFIYYNSDIAFPLL